MEKELFKKNAKVAFDELYSSFDINYWGILAYFKDDYVNPFEFNIDTDEYFVELVKLMTSKEETKENVTAVAKSIEYLIKIKNVEFNDLNDVRARAFSIIIKHEWVLDEL